MMEKLHGAKLLCKYNKIKNRLIMSIKYNKT